MSNGSNTEAAGLANLASAGMSEGERLDHERKLKDIARTWADVVATRVSNVHATGSSVLPGRWSRPDQERGTGWQPERPLDRPPGIDLIDAMCIADDKRQREKKTK